MKLFKRPYSGTKIYILIFQVASLLPLAHILYTSGVSDGVIPHGLTSVLFDIGICALPRCETLLLSTVYRITLSEIFIYFALALIAFIYGVVMNKLLSLKKTSSVAKYVAAVLIACDIAVRALPFRFNFIFGTLYFVIGLVIRLTCIALVVSDIIISRKKDR